MRYPGGCLIYLDNASIHRKAVLLVIIKLLNQHLGTNFALVFPPPYSPELNPVRARLRRRRLCPLARLCSAMLRARDGMIVACACARPIGGSPTRFPERSQMTESPIAAVADRALLLDPEVQGSVPPRYHQHPGARERRADRCGPASGRSGAGGHISTTLSEMIVIAFSG